MCPNSVYSAIVQRGKIRVQCFVICVGGTVYNLATKAIERPLQSVELFKAGSN